MQKQEDGKGSGFLITCDKNKQKQAIKDAYNFINEYIEDIYGDIENELIEKQLAKQGKDHNLQNEMQVRSALKNKIRLLSSVDTNVNCLVFIKINQKVTDVKIDPYAVVNKMMKDVHKDDRQLTRFCHKIMPVERSFKAQHFKMLDQIDAMFQNRDNSEMKSWALNFKCRNNSKFSYKEVLAETENIAKKYGHFVDIYYPQWTVAVEIVNHLMCLSIVEGYKEYDEFRLHKKGKKVNNNESTNKSEAIKQKKYEKSNEHSHHRKIYEKIEVKQENIKQEIIEKQEKEVNQQRQQKQQQNKDNGLKQQISANLLHQKIEINDDEDVDFI